MLNTISFLSNILKKHGENLRNKKNRLNHEKNWKTKN